MSNIRGFSDLKKDSGPKGGPGGGGGFPPGFPGFPGGPGGPGGFPSGGSKGPANHGKVKILHKDGELKQELAKAGGKLVVVDFTASWCGPCQMIAPHYAELSEKFTNVIFLKIDVDECQQTADECGVRAMPTFQFYKNSKKVDEFAGADPSKLKSMIEKHATSDSSSSSSSSSGHSWGGGGYVLGSKSATTAPSSTDNTTSTTSTSASTSSTSASSSSNTESNEDNEIDTLFMTNLMEMGFSAEQAKRAIKATNASSLEAAVDWCFNHPEPTSSNTLGGPTTTTSSNTSEATPMEVEATSTTTSTSTNEPKTRVKTVHNAVCNNCMDQIIGIRYKCRELNDYDLCSMCYNDRTLGPEYTFDSYEEDLVLPNTERKPLSKEEIEEKKRQLREKVAKLREERGKEEAAAELEREKVRRVSGKEAVEIKRQHELKSMEREAAARKREKEEEKKAKAAIKARIEQDKKEREAKRSGTTTSTSTTTAPTPVATTTTSSVNYSDSMIQVRLLDGNNIKATFKATDPIRTVHNHIALLTGTEQFSLVTTFPRKVYSPKDSTMDTTTLKQAELVPSGTFIVTKL